jgi:hypothetical protein
MRIRDIFTGSQMRKVAPRVLLIRGNSLTMKKIRTSYRVLMMEVTGRMIAVLVQYGDSDQLTT